MFVKRFYRSRHFFFFLIVLIHLLLPASLFSLEKTSVWLGGTGHWDDAHYWSPSGVPDNDHNTTYSVFIDGGDPISSTVYFSIDDPNFAVSNLTIDLGDRLIQQDFSIFTIEGGDIVNNGTWDTSAPTGGATLAFTENSIITGTGTMDLQGCISFVITNNGNAVTLGPYQKIKGPLNFLFEDGLFINKGEIRQYGTKPMNFSPSYCGVINEGTIIAGGSGGINFDNGVITNTGTIQGRAISQMSFLNMKITGGTLGALDGGKITYHYNTFLQDINLYGEGVVSNSSPVTFAGSIANSGRIFITQTSSITQQTIVTIGDGGVLTDSGAFWMGQSYNTETIAAIAGDSLPLIRTDGFFTQGISHTIAGSGYILNGSGGMLNEGTIIAIGASPLAIHPDHRGVVNKGTVKIRNGGRIQIYNSEYFENLGDVEIDQGGLYADAGYTQTAGVTSAKNSFMEMGFRNNTLTLSGGELKVDGVIIGNVVNDGGTIYPGASVGCLAIRGNLTNTGTISMEIGGNEYCNTLDYLEISGTAHLAGKLELNFINGVQPAISETYNIISYKGLSSEFPEYKVTGLPPNRKANLWYFPNMLSVFIEEQNNVPPTINLLTPSENDEISTTTYLIRWTDDDPDDDALITLFYSPEITAPIGITLAENLSEDDEADSFAWDTTLVPEGIYWIQAEITDGINYPVFSFSPGSVKVTHVTKEDIIDHLLAGTILPSERLCFADFNNDGIIDAADVVAFCIIWGTKGY